MSEAPTVTIEDHGRCGLIWYREGVKTILFDWELCGTYVAEIWPRSLQELKSEEIWPASRIPEILDFVAREVVSKRANGCSYQKDLNSCRIFIT
jgi:hypothetical protein